MNERATIRILPNGRRLHLNDGPIDLIIGADASRADIQRAYKAAACRFVTILDELCAELPVLRTNIAAIGNFDSASTVVPQCPIAKRMIDAVTPYRGRCFITPMAAVAGAVAEAVLAAMTDVAQLDRAYVNNGGDIAFHLAPGQTYKIGMVGRPGNPSLFGSVEISSSIPVRGVATSGWRGRSFSLGIADAVTVLANSAAEADAAATIIANAVDLPGNPSITRVAAREISSDSDLVDLPVTRGVGRLSPSEVAEALGAGAGVAEELHTQGLIHAAALCLQGHVRFVDPQASGKTKRFVPAVPSLYARGPM
ncbi:MAG: UPF0280 family protein [Candidatus Acidiferrum sp.]